MSCPGSGTAQRGTRISAVMRPDINDSRSILKIKVLLPKLI